MNRVRGGRWSRDRWARRIYHKDADPRGLVIGRWELPTSQKGKEESELYGDSDDSVVIFSIVYFRKYFLFYQVMCLP